MPNPKPAGRWAVSSLLRQYNPRRFRLGLTVIVFVLGVAAVAFAQEATDMPRYMPYWRHHDWGWSWGFGHMLVGTLIFFLFLALIAGLFAVLFRWLTGPRGGMPGARSSALDLLEERYAKGEIGREEFLQKKKDLG
jgi:putative membrane protein